MSENRNADEARQSEGGKGTFVVLIVSTTIAAAIAIGAYFYVFGADNEDLDGDVPEIGVTQDPPEAPSQ